MDPLGPPDFVAYKLNQQDISLFPSFLHNK